MSDAFPDDPLEEMRQREMIEEARREREFDHTPQAERRVVCEACGEVLYTETVGGPDDDAPELGNADRLVDPDDCALCNDALN